MTLPLLSACIHIVKTIQKHRDTIEDNDYQSIRICERVNGLYSSLIELNRISENDFTIGQRNAVEKLADTLNQANELVDIQKKPGWWDKRLHANERHKKFERLQIQLDDRVQELQLALATANIQLQLPHYWRLDQNQHVADEEHDLLERKKELEWAQNVLLGGGHMMELEKIRKDIPANTDKHRLQLISETLLEVNNTLADIQRRRDENELETQKYDISAPIDLNSKAWLINLEDLEPHPRIGIEKPIATGSNYIVYKGKFMGSDDVAIKVFDPKHVNEEELNRLKRTLNFACNIQSPRIARVYGANLEAPYACLVVEYVYNGILSDRIKDNTIKWTKSKILRVGKTLAEGLAYLHRANILHRNVQPRSILLDKNFNAKLDEFGFAIQSEYKKNYVINRELQRYLPPECFDDPPIYDEQSEVYAWGMIMYEIISKHIPYNKLTDNDISRFKRKHKHPRILSKIGDTCSSDLANLINACWRAKSEQRPTSINLTNNLSSMWRDLVASGETEVNPQVAAFTKNALARIRLKKQVEKQTIILEDERRKVEIAQVKISEKSAELDHWTSVANQLKEENQRQEELREKMLLKLNNKIQHEREQKEKLQNDVTRHMETLKFIRTCQQCTIQSIQPNIRYLCRNNDGTLCVDVYEGIKSTHSKQWRILFEDDIENQNDYDPNLELKCRVVSVDSNEVLQWDTTKRNVKLTYLVSNPVSLSTLECWWYLQPLNEKNKFHLFTLDHTHLLRLYENTPTLISEAKQSTILKLSDAAEIEMQQLEKIMKRYSTSFEQCIKSTFQIFFRHFSYYLQPHGKGTIHGKYYEKTRVINETQWRLISRPKDKNSSHIPTPFAPFRCQIELVVSQQKLCSVNENIKLLSGDDVTNENSIWLIYPYDNYQTCFFRILNEYTKCHISMPISERRDTDYINMNIKHDDISNVHIEFMFLPQFRNDNIGGLTIYNPSTNNYIVGDQKPYALSYDRDKGGSWKRVFHWCIIVDHLKYDDNIARVQFVHIAGGRVLGVDGEITTLTHYYSTPLTQCDKFWWKLYPNDNEKDMFRIVNCDTNMQLSIQTRNNEDCLRASWPYQNDPLNHFGCRDDIYWFKLPNVSDFENQRVDRQSDAITSGLSSLGLW